MSPLSLELVQNAIHSAVAIPLSGRTHVLVKGRDRAAFIHNFCTNHVKQLTSGQGCEAFLTSIKGRILFHVLIYAGPESLWIETEPGRGSELITHLDRYIITEDVQLVDHSSLLHEVYVSGRRAAECLRTVLGTSLEALHEPGQLVVEIPTGRWSQIDHSNPTDSVQAASEPSQKADSRIERHRESVHRPVLELPLASTSEMFVRRFSYGTAPGFSLVGPSGVLEQVLESLASSGVSVAPPDLFEVLRIEGMFPRHGIDLQADHLAQEAHRTSRTISFVKGCYLGQEPIARIDALGHVNRLLCGVETLEPTAEMPAGIEVFAAIDAVKPIGTLTSTTHWPLTGQALGLGMLRSDCSPSGTLCYLGPQRVPARVRPAVGSSP